MDISVNELEYCKLEVIYKSDPQDVKDKRDFVAKEMAKTYTPKGFRKGRATPEVIRLSFPNEVQGHLQQEMLNKAFTDAVVEKNIKPFGGPSISSVKLDGNNFECKFSIHTLPELELKEYKNFDIPKYHPAQTIEELAQKMLQEVRAENGEMLPYTENDFVQNGDSIVVKYDTFLDNVPIEKLSSEGTVLQVGRINVKGFDEQISGMKVGDEREFTLRSPEDFEPEHANKDLLFKVKLLSGSKNVPAPLDDNLAKKMGLEDFNALQTQANGVASARIQEVENSYYQQQISQRLIEKHDIKIPNWILEPEAQVQAKIQKLDWEKLGEEDKNKLFKLAEDGIKLSLILEKIRGSEPEAQVSDTELMNIVKQNLSQYTNEIDKVIADIYQKGQMSMLLSRVKDEFVLNFIIKNCNLIE